MICAAASAAITDGRLSLTSLPPIGQTSDSERLRGAAVFQEPAFERRFLGFRSDQAGIGGVTGALPALRW